MRLNSTTNVAAHSIWPPARRALPALAIVSALAAWYLTPTPALALLWAAVFAALAWRWPRLALALTPLTFPFWFAPAHLTSHLSFPLSELMLAILALVSAAQLGLRLARSRSWQLRRMGRAYLARLGCPVLLGAALLLAGMTVGVIIARAPQPALRAWRWEIIEPLVFGALVVWRLRGRWLWWTLWAFVASGVMVAALALAQATFAHVTFAPLGAGGGLISYPAWSSPDWRATAIIYGSPNSAGAWMERALPLALAIALWPRAAGRVEWLTAALSVAALLAGIALTGSRGAWLGAVVGVALVGGMTAVGVAWRGRGRAWGRANEFAPEGPTGHNVRLRGRRNVTTRLLAVALVVALLYGTSAIWLAPLVRLAGGAHGGSGEVRLLIWRAAEAIARDHPLFGVGPDQFLYYYDPRYTNHPYLIATLNGRPTAAASEPNLSHPHNLGLELWLSAGLAGLLGYMLALAAAVGRGLTPYPLSLRGEGQPGGRGSGWRAMLWLGSLASGWRGAVVVGVIGALAAGLAHGLVDSAYFQPDYALAFWWGVAALIALRRASR